MEYIVNFLVNAYIINGPSEFILNPKIRVYMVGKAPKTLSSQIDLNFIQF